VTDKQGCRSADPSNAVEIYIRALPPIPKITIDKGDVCEGGSTTLRVAQAGAGDYKWYHSRDGRNFDSIAYTSDNMLDIPVRKPGETFLGLQFSDAGIYAVEIIDTWSCRSFRRGDTTLNVLGNPLVRIRETRACENWTAEHTVNFADPKGGTFTGLGCDSGMFVPKKAQAGSATVTYTYTGTNGCTSSDTKTIDLIPLPNKPFVTAGGPTSVCEDSISVSLSTRADESSQYRYTYQWYKDGFLLPGERGSSYEATKMGAYAVEICNQELCWADSRSDSVVVSVLELPKTPTIATRNPFICPGGSTALFVESDERGIFQWYKGDNRKMEKLVNEIDSVYSATQIGQYAVDLIGLNGCRSEQSNLITVGEYVLPGQPEIVPSQQTLYAGLDYKLLVKNPQAGHEYEWYKNDLSTEVSGAEFPVITLSGADTGRYTVRVVDEHGCQAWSKAYPLGWSDAELLIPNIFTPNGDGINDYFQILGLEDFLENKLEIVNKQGALIFSQKNYNNRWNGDGRPNDVFFYRLTLKRHDGSSFTLRGFVHLKN
jgi:gliding motility-associated-like protein